MVSLYSTDFFKQPSLAEFRRCLDAEMKRLKASGESCRKKKAESITEEEEGKIWEMKLLGDCLLYTSPSPRDGLLSRMPSSA